jgi:hypothetical protein
MSVFGRRRREQEATEAAREAERRALFEQLAKRPETVCPFLGMAHDRAGYRPAANDDHRCYAFGEAAELSHDQQSRVCLERGYGNCPRYLRGVLVIPTEEIEALRRPAPLPVASAVAEAAPPPPPARRRAPVLLAAVMLLLLLGAGAGGAFLLLGGDGLDPIARPTATPTPVATLRPTPTPPLPSPEPATPTPPPGVATPTPEPTPEAADTFTHYEVSVAPGSYTVFQFSPDGAVTGSRRVSFDSFSQGRAEPVLSAEIVHWQIQEGPVAGFSYRSPDSGPFRVRAVFAGPAGERRSFFLDDDDLTEFPEGTPAPQPAS